MSCNSPIAINHNGINYTVPCGYCAGCRIDRTFEWSERIKHECNFFDRNGFGNSFVTLTYDDDHFPSRGCDKIAIQKFFKRLRSYLSRNHIHFAGNDFKYFLVAEYGDIGARPHYHAILMGLDFAIARRPLKECWKFGFIESDPLLSGGIRYVLKYLEKCRPMKEESKIYEGFGLNPPFYLCSKGIGSRWLYEHAEDLRTNNGYYSRGRFVKPSRYYRRKIGMPSIKDVQTERELIARAKESGIDYNRYLYQIRLAREKSLRTRAQNEGRIL